MVFCAPESSAVQRLIKHPPGQLLRPGFLLLGWLCALLPPEVLTHLPVLKLLPQAHSLTVLS